MSRGFDGFEIDDFRDSDFGPDREVSRSPSSDWNKWTELHNIHREEARRQTGPRSFRPFQQRPSSAGPRRTSPNNPFSASPYPIHRPKQDLFTPGFRNSHAVGGWQV